MQTPAKFFRLAPVTHGGLSGHAWIAECFGETSVEDIVTLIGSGLCSLCCKAKLKQYWYLFHNVEVKLANSWLCQLTM
jgi:hypothetical protein